MRQPRLTPAKATLLMLGVGTVALMGVPGFGHYDPPEGAITGLVLDELGYAVAGAEIALFDDEGLSLVEIVRADGRGRFAFHQSPDHFHVFARCEEEDSIGSWVRDRIRAPRNELEIVLSRGVPASLHVQDEDGKSLAGAEVRVHDSDQGSAVVLRTRTGPEGLVTFTCPRRATLVVHHPGDYRTSQWLLDNELPEDGANFGITLHSRREVTGRVVDEAGKPLPGMVVSGWEGSTPSRWNGYSLTDEDGGFRISALDEEVLLRVVDPLQAHLPVETRVTVGKGAVHLPLPEGLPLDVRLRTNNTPVPARVRVWSQGQGAWGWSSASDSDGQIRVQVSPEHSVVAQPLVEGYGPTEAWDLIHQGTALELSPPIDG